MKLSKNVLSEIMVHGQYLFHLLNVHEEIVTVSGIMGNF